MISGKCKTQFFYKGKKGLSSSLMRDRSLFSLRQLTASAVFNHRQARRRMRGRNSFRGSRNAGTRAVGCQAAQFTARVSIWPTVALPLCVRFAVRLPVWRLARSRRWWATVHQTNSWSTMGVRFVTSNDHFFLSSVLPGQEKCHFF